jgi:hypothetical protein
MTRREEAKKTVQRRSKGRRADYPIDVRQESFSTWFQNAVTEDTTRGNDVSEDVHALLLPPRREAKAYNAMYAYGNHIRVRGA